MTLREHADAWLDYITPFRAPSTITRYRQALRALLETFGGTEPAALDANALEAWHGARADKIAPATRSTEAVILKKLLRKVKREDLANALESPRVNPDPKEIPVTWAQARAAVLKTKEPPRSALLLVLNSGLRIGELLHLRPQDVEGAAIEVREHPDWKPKTRKSTRSIPKNAEARACLKKLKGEAHVCELTRDKFAKALEDACEKAGLDRLVPHDLRHLFITRHVQKNTHPEMIRRLAGHSSLATTMKYMHPTTDDLAKAQKKIEAGT